MEAKKVYIVYKYNKEGQLRLWKTFTYFPEALLNDPDYCRKYKIEEATLFPGVKK